MRNMVFLLLAFYTSRVQGERIETIEQCGVHCSQGLRCKAKSHLSLEFCKTPPAGVTSEVFSNTSISTVMKCGTPQRCSLHLRVRTVLHISEHTHGIHICTFAAGMMERCRIVSFSRTERAKLVDKQVNIQEDCLEVGAGQDMHVTLKTWPWFCDVAVFSLHRVADCSNTDVRKSVTECITGRIYYEEDVGRKELSVSVSEMLEDRDYHLRLCHKDYLCTGTGDHVLLKKENPLKNATFKYSRAVPCLCIEGWSATSDAPRVQVCPFKNRVEELWSGISFDPVTETLSWEAACHINAVVALCELRDGGMCEDLPRSLQTFSRGKVTYSAVDPHPQLCMKFITEAGEWLKCPFLEGDFPVWHLEVTTPEGYPQLLVTSRVRANLSLSMCARTGSNMCEDTHTTLVHAEKFKSVRPNLTMDFCQPTYCIKAKRLDAQYGITVLHCQLPCSPAFKSVSTDTYWQLVHMVSLPAMLATAVVMATFAMAIILVYKIKQMTQALDDVCSQGDHTGPLTPMTGKSGVESQLACKGLLHMPYNVGSPQLRQGDKSNLLEGFSNNFEV
ncbi:interleukin-17 receptor E-like protein [Brachyhypopomus gauderio]|uniref:interleukin-17 receptor E-like protein n=1 Tax=Brachyhypopomus gauderio TaxID=698409 RepID=UPI004042C964